MARTFTREEFYELVWTKPLTKLAKEFALSDVALHKICRKHDVPNPPLGWWAKKAAGKDVKRIPLPKAGPDTPEKILIADGDLARQPSAIVTAREKARVAASSAGEGELVRPHPVVERTLSRLRKAKPSSIGMVTARGPDVVSCNVAAVSVDRLALALPRIVGAALVQGFELVPGEEKARFKSTTETIEVAISETLGREKHQLTEAERAEEDAWRRKRDKAARRNTWSDLFLNRPRFEEWDYYPTGKLALEFERVYVAHGFSPRRSFRDAKIQRLDNMASDIAVGLAVLAAAKTEERHQREARQRQVEEERRTRENSARLRYIEERRVSGLGKLLAELDEIDRLRRLLPLITAGDDEEAGARVCTFIAWASGQLADREAGLSARALEDRFAREHLFGEDDDTGFRYSPWQ